MDQQNCIRILRLPEVEKRVGARKPTVYRWIKENDFPKPIRIGVRAVGWIEHEINGWIRSRDRADI